MDRYQRVERPRPESAITENEVRITAQGLIRNYVNYAINLLQERRLREIVLKAMGQAISKTVAIAEILKKRIPGLHQDTCISSVSITDVWEPIEEGLVPLETTRHVSMISISLSTSELNKESPGYQAPEEAQEQQTRPRYTQPRQPRYPQNDYYHDESYGGGRGGMRGRGRGRGRGYQGGGYRNIQARYDNNPNENRYDNYQGRYDNNNQGRYENNQGRYDNNQGRYDNNQGRYENNQGRYERNQGGRYENYRGGYGGGYGGGYNQRYGGGGGGYGGPNQDNEGYNANRGRGGGMRGRGNYGYRGGYERGRGGPRGGRGYYRGRGRENINQA